MHMYTQQVFATFCGLGIQSVMGYENLLKANAKQSVALEMLSYHASATAEEAQKLMVRTGIEIELSGVKSSKAG